MHATIQCSCGKHLDADALSSGERAQCPACGCVLVIGEPVKANAAIQAKTPASKHSQTSITASLPTIAELPSIEQPSKRGPLASCFGVGLIVMFLIAGLVFVGSYFLLQPLIDDQRMEAATQVKGPLTTACIAFRIKNNRWPESLEEMLVRNNNGGPYLESKDALLDPWGNRYRYDAKGPMNKGAQPDIWCEVPNDGTKIGNWPDR